MKGLSSFDSLNTGIENSWVGLSCCNLRMSSWAFFKSVVSFAKSCIGKYFSLSFPHASISSIREWRLSYGANEVAMSLSINMPSCSANNFICFSFLSAFLNNFAKFAGINTYCDDYGAVDNVSVESTPYVAVATPEVDGADMGSGAARHTNSVHVAAPTVAVVSSATLVVCPLGPKTLGADHPSKLVPTIDTDYAAPHSLVELSGSG
ncbi:hypothetical protein HAX54_025912 [Datura stramonium]|uniref:Uncharacterized protein n=1 Tax=Datura stramonium TaxID=4076 RepID=A0ABS8S7L2_DATST|nr:hypothetical protein [Datura stramonium]